MEARRREHGEVQVGTATPVNRCRSGRDGDAGSSHGTAVVRDSEAVVVSESGHRGAKVTRKCQGCGEAVARNHYKKWENNRETELFLCDACAEKRGLAVTGGTDKIDLAQSLNVMLHDMEGLSDGAVGNVQCTRCGLLYSTFRETGRLGCAHCYSAFEQQLRPLLRRVHGAVQHVGKTPAIDDAHAARRRQLRELQERMQRAVARDAFEEAARLRDQIRALRDELPTRTPPDGAGDDSGGEPGDEPGDEKGQP
jgi:protein arginine kinase activator